MNNLNSGAESSLCDDIPENVRKFTSIDIRNATNNFSSNNSIGAGGFGTVYRGEIDGTLVAVKRLKEETEERDFITEFKTLIRFKHENLLSIIGYCDVSTRPSIVLEYMPNGSLEDRLKDKSNPLPWDVRLKIAYGAALGINHLHTSHMVHRDIKSANILLNKNFVPKVADFGFVRDGDSGLSQIRPVTLNYCYTLFYEAPEVLIGDVSVKLDTFSFGVVLLELLTGLRPYHEGKPLRNYARKEILGQLLDSGAKWNKSAAEKIYKISKLKCLKEKKEKRKTISQILPALNECFSYIPLTVPSVLEGTQGNHAGNRPPPAAGDDASSTENSSYYASSQESSSYYASSEASSNNYTNSGESLSYHMSSQESSSYHTSSGASSNNYTSSVESPSSEESSNDDVEEDSYDDVEEDSYAERQWKMWQKHFNNSTEDSD